MKAKLIFNLPDEQAQYDHAVRGWDWRDVVAAIDDHLRSRLKHGELTDAVRDALDKARTYLHEELESRNLRMYE